MTLTKESFGYIHLQTLTISVLSPMQQTSSSARNRH